MNFDGIIGNNKIKKELEENVKNGNISHSYMFLGQEGIGKRQIAIEFAKMILCLSEKNRACDICNSCIKFKSNNNPDFTILEPDGNSLKIAQIRDIQEKIYEKPIVSNKKVFIIDDSDKMTEEAQNSLLKTLEEPPEYIVIILITSNENKLLNTIKSRCLKISFNNIPTEEMTEYITKNQIMR
ncbi:MAG: DNA polymerase III subunit delta' [Clostridia bacterium]